jgi:hypothetical protein
VRRAILFTAFALLLPLSTGRADQASVLANLDNTLYAESAAESNGAGDYFFAGKNGMGQMRRCLVSFDVASAVPAGSTITSAKLVLYMSRTNAGPKTIELHAVTSSWGEGTSNAGQGEGGGAAATLNDATWMWRFFNTIAWTTLGGDFVAGASASLLVDQIGFYTFGSSPGMVADVQSWLNTPASNFGWIFLNTDLIGTPTAKRFDSRTNPTTSHRPRLVIDFTPPSPFTALCFGDGSGTPCPCGNAGLAGNGCASSMNANGANLAASGNASLASDTVVLSGSAMPDAPVLYFQCLGPENGGAGTVFGDGLLCATGGMIRLDTKTNAGGASQYPDVGDPSISVIGSVMQPSTRFYQCWYRNAAPFCTPDTFNSTNAVSIAWGP